METDLYGDLELFANSPKTDLYGDAGRRKNPKGTYYLCKTATGGRKITKYWYIWGFLQSLRKRPLFDLYEELSK